MMVMRGLEGHVTIWNDEGGVCLSLLRGREPCQHLMSPWLGFEEWESGNRSRTDWRGEPAGRAAFLKADVKSEVAAFRTEITPQQEKSLDGISCQWKGAGREKGQRHHLGFLPEGCMAWPGRVDVTHGGSGCQCLVLMSCCWNLYIVKMSAGIKIGDFWRAVNEALESTFRRGQEEEGAEAPGWYLLPQEGWCWHQGICGAPAEWGLHCPSLGSFGEGGLLSPLISWWPEVSAQLTRLPAVRRHLCRGLWHP